MNKFSSILVLFSALALFGCSAERSAQAYLQSATNYYNDGQYDLARVELKNALRIDPELSEAHYLQAQFHMRSQNWARMVASLRKSVELDPANVQAQLELGKLLTALGDIAGSELLLSVLATKHKNNAAVLANLAVIKIRQGKLDEAQELVTAALAIDSTGLDVLLVASSFELVKANSAAASTYIERGLGLFPEDIGFYYLAIQASVRKDDLAETGVVLQKMIDAFPDKLAFRKSLAMFYASTGDRDRAEQVLRSAVSELSQNTEAKLMLAGFLAEADQEQAVAYLTNLARTEDESTSGVQLMLADLYERSGDSTRSTLLLQELSREDTSEIAQEASRKLAESALRRNDVEEAKAIVNELLAADRGSPGARLILAETNRLTGDFDGAIGVLRGLIADQPDLADAHAQLGLTYLQIGSDALAEQAFATGLGSDPMNLPSAKGLAKIQIENEDYSRARSTLKRIIENGRADRTINELNILATLGHKEWSKAESLASRLGEAGYGQRFADYVRAISLQMQGNYSASNVIYVSLLESDPSDNRALVALLKSLATIGDVPKAKSFIAEFLDQHPELEAARRSAITFLVDNDEWQVARNIASVGLELDYSWDFGYNALAAIESQNGKPEKAYQVYADGVEQLPNSPELLLGKAIYGEQLGQIDKAIQDYKLVLEKTPGHPTAANNLAVLLEKKGDLDGAGRYASLLTNSQHPLLMDTRGWILFRQGKLNEAIRILEAAASGAPNHPDVNYHLGVALYEAKRLEGAREHLRKAVLNSGASTFDGKQHAVALLATL